MITHQDINQLKKFDKFDKRKYCPIWLEKINDEINRLKKAIEQASKSLTELAENEDYAYFMLEDETQGAIHKIILEKLDVKFKLFKLWRENIIEMIERAEK